MSEDPPADEDLTSYGSSPDGRFTYEVLSYESAGPTRWVRGRSKVARLAAPIVAAILTKDGAAAAAAGGTESFARLTDHVSGRSVDIPVGKGVEVWSGAGELGNDLMTLTAEQLTDKYIEPAQSSVDPDAPTHPHLGR